jgi:hypothetical protein
VLQCTQLPHGATLHAECCSTRLCRVSRLPTSSASRHTAVGSGGYATGRPAPRGKRELGFDAPLGPVDRDKHPFAATGGRIVTTLAKLIHAQTLDTECLATLLILICAAGGQGTTRVGMRAMVRWRGTWTGCCRSNADSNVNTR